MLINHKSNIFYLNLYNVKPTKLKFFIMVAYYRLIDRELIACLMLFYVRLK